MRLLFHVVGYFKRPALDLADKPRELLGILSRHRALRGTEGRLHVHAAIERQLGNLIDVVVGLPLADLNAFEPGPAGDDWEVLGPIVCVESSGVLGLTVVEDAELDHSTPSYSGLART